MSKDIKVIVVHDLYNVSLTLSQLDCGGLNEAIPMVATYCGGVVWGEIETIEQPLPTYAKYIDTFYNINVFYDFVTEAFLFEEFN